MSDSDERTKKSGNSEGDGGKDRRWTNLFDPSNESVHELYKSDKAHRTYRLASATSA